MSFKSTKKNWLLFTLSPLVLAGWVGVIVGGPAWLADIALGVPVAIAFGYCVVRGWGDA